MSVQEQDSEHLQDLEERAEEASPMPDLDTDEEPMPQGEDAGDEAADPEEPLKRIDEDVSGDEETEDITDVEAGDA